MNRPSLAQVLRPVEQATGLSNAHYTDPATYSQERETLLFQSWAGLAVAADVPEPGDARPIDFAGLPVLLIRDRAGTVRVFQNICRHRGMILVDAPRKIEGAIRCPYHSWCYSSAGKLVSTPHVGGPGHNTHDAINRDDLGLIEIRSEIWRDVVWINVSGDAPPLSDVMGTARTRWSDFEQPMFHGGADSQFDLHLNANWKLAVENYCESYHLPWVHPGLNSYSRLEDHYNIEQPQQFSGQGTRVYRQLAGSHGERFPDFTGTGESWQEQAEYLALYPNVLMGVHRDHAFTIILLPQGPEKTVEQAHIYYSSPETDADLRRRNTAQWKEVFEEDIFVVEGMQKGRHAPGFDGGRFSPVMDGPTHCFHDWVARRLSSASQQPVTDG